MPGISPSLAKNLIRRSLLDLVDPSRSEAALKDIWDDFDASCAYCGKQLRRNGKDDHIDHLVSASANGSNHKANRVLSCAQGNEAEKRDSD